MDKLTKKRVHWKEKDRITGEIHDEDVDIYTSADAVTFEDGQNLEDKIQLYAKDEKINKHIADNDNPHNLTPDKIGACSEEQFKYLKSLILSGDTVTSSSNTGYSEVGEWADGNPDNENRIGYFVAVDKSSDGITMVKANRDSDVRGVTITNPAFAANASVDKFDDEGRLLPKYNYVAFIGFAVVYDRGRCTVNERCISDDDGTAIPSTNTMGYQVIERVAPDKVLILIEPNGDMLNRIKDDITDLRNVIQLTDGEYKYKLGKDKEGMYLQVIEIL